MMTSKPKGKVFRFGLGYRLAHWNNAIFFLLLLLSGLMFVFKGVSGLLGEAGVVWADRIHRAAAWPYTFLTIPLLAFMAGKETKEWLKHVFTWTKDDIAFVAAFPKALFNRNYPLPAQDKFNGGEKINSMLTIFGTVVMIVTGWTMALSQYLGPQVMAWALPIHDVTAILLGAVIMGHMWLSLVHPDNKAAMPGMVNGYVDEHFAKHHYAKWYKAMKDERSAEAAD